MALVNTKWRKDISSNAGEAVMRVIGCGITAAILNKVTSTEFTSKSDVNKTIGNVAGPALSLIGVAADFFLSNSMLRGIGQGMYTIGIPKSIAVIAPSVGSYMGLSGISANSIPTIMNGVSRPAIMNGYTPAATTTYVTPRAAIANAAANVKANADMNESKANALAGSMIQN